MKINIKEVLKDCPSDYVTCRLLSVALCELDKQLVEHEARILDEYGTELLQVIHSFNQGD